MQIICNFLRLGPQWMLAEFGNSNALPFPPRLGLELFRPISADLAHRLPVVAPISQLLS